MRYMRLRRILTAASVPLVLALAACAPAEDENAADQTPTAEVDVTDLAACAAEETLEKGTLTVGTDSPAYEPWFVDNDPSNGKGFESAVAYAVAEKLGFDRGAVTWVKVPFNNSYQPGAKKFDFDINQISISAERAKVIDFSDGYYSAAQAVIALKGNPAAEAAEIDDLDDFRLGAQTGTTSLTAIRDIIEPDADPLVFEDTNAAKQALLNDQVDAILADLPTAFYITAVEIPKASIIGQFQPAKGEQEEFGLLLEKGNGLTACVNGALAALTEDGTMAEIEKEWLSETVDVPVLRD